jgi:DNA-binding CsgD family transcriptional regulator
MQIVNEARAQRLVATLSPMQRRVMRLLCLLGNNKRIAAEAGLSVWTVDDHLQAAYARLGARDRVTAAVVATKGGLV